jgi:hypothetical protein
LFAYLLVPYTSATSVSTATPLKLLFTRFPPFIEAIVQKIQNYYSTYNHVESENRPASPPDNKPVNATTTLPAPTSTPVTELPSSTTAPPLPENTGSQSANGDQIDHDTSPAPS